MSSPQTELDREDMKHHEWMLITNFRLHLSPIGPNPQRILDIGTGTGKFGSSWNLFKRVWILMIIQVYGPCRLASLPFQAILDKELISIADTYPSAEVIGTGEYLLLNH